MGGGIGMGNTCKPMAVSFQCMTKSTTIKKKKNTPAEHMAVFQKGLSYTGGSMHCEFQRKAKMKSKA